MGSRQSPKILKKNIDHAKISKNQEPQMLLMIDHNTNQSKNSLDNDLYLGQCLFKNMAFFECLQITYLFAYPNSNLYVA